MERQNVEWKRQWDDKFLRQICGFANSEGGVMKLGVEDDGTVVGVKDPKSDMKSITDTIANKLSIYPTVDVDETTNVITITVQIPCSCRPRRQVLHPHRQHHTCRHGQGV